MDRLPFISVSIGIALIVSGLVHIFWMIFSGETWEGPLSVRKPILFGISTGVMLCSLAWVASKSCYRKFNIFLVNVLSAAMFVEVGLITVQYWRGVPSHFNRATPLDAQIEFWMSAIVLIFTIGLCVLCFTAYRLPRVVASQRIAIRGGMGLLLVSCLLGGVATIAGEINLSAGQNPEIWKKGGVLKFPHGISIHALQWLPLAAWIFEAINPKTAASATRWMVVNQWLLIGYASWQTFAGFGRFEPNLIGGILLGLALFCFVFSVVKMIPKLGNRLKNVSPEM